MSLPAAVLWDMDGTLVDTEPYWIAAEHDIVEEHGGTWSEELSHQLVGKDLLVAATFIRDNSAVEWSPEQIVDEMLGRVIVKVHEHMPWRPGARELLTALKAEGVPSALVTMSWRSLADAVLGELPDGTFDVVVTGDEVSHGKPHPEPYRAAARLLGVRRRGLCRNRGLTDRCPFRRRGGRADAGCAARRHGAGDGRRGAPRHPRRADTEPGRRARTAGPGDRNPLTPL